MRSMQRDLFRRRQRGMIRDIVGDAREFVEGQNWPTVLAPG